MSTILVNAFSCDYWKPVQCGIEDGTDSQFVRDRIDQTRSTVHSEAYCLDLPKSPHLAAAKQGVSVSLSSLQLPNAKRPMIVEGAGGVLVPINDRDYLIDLAVREKMPVLFVTKNYLGSLNHTFLSIEALRQRGLSIIGLVFSGPQDHDLEKFVAKRCDLPILFSVPPLSSIDAQSIQTFSQTIKAKVEFFL